VAAQTDGHRLRGTTRLEHERQVGRLLHACEQRAEWAGDGHFDGSVCFEQRRGDDPPDAQRQRREQEAAEKSPT
jgi:hypothetical protein